jgi:Tol biopolymer transport system component
VAAGGTVAALLLTSGNGRKTSTAAATSSSAGPSASDAPSPATSPAGAALAALPRSAAPLPEGTLVIPRQTGDGIHLYLVDSTDGTSTQITSSSSPDVGPVLSPDRRSIAFLRGNADGTAALMVQPAAGGEQQPLIRALPAGCVRPGRPAWNPADPTEIALPCADAQGTLTLRVVALDGTVVTTLAAGPIFDDVAFSPDGTHVVYWAVTRRGPGIDGGPLYSIAVDGGSPPLRLTDVGSVDADPDFSPDGRSIVFRRAVSSTDVRICLMRADGSGLTYLTSGHIDQDPTWSPDGSRLAFKSDRPGAGGGDQIWVMDTSGQGLRQLSGVPGTSTNAPAWGPR